MSENKKTQMKLDEKFGQETASIVLRRALDVRKVVDTKLLTDKDGVTYDEFIQEYKGTTYKIRPIHVSIDEVSEYANPKCNVCYGKGYYTSNISKAVLRNPGDHVILSKQPFEGASDEEKERLIAEERKSTTWRVLFPCECAVKRMRKAEPNFFLSDDRSIMLKIEYEESAA